MNCRIAEEVVKNKTLIEESLKKANAISGLTLAQLDYETNSWKRALETMRDENTLLKNRLSEILKAEFNKNLLESVERFHANLIKQDEVIRLLRNDAAELAHILNGHADANEKHRYEVCKKYEYFRKVILNAKKDFGALQYEFHEYFGKNL